MKILAIKFKYLGDIAIMAPSLRLLRQSFPDATIDCLIPHHARPILEHLPYIDTIHTLPPKKGLIPTLKKLWALRNENYDLSIDFVGNDRGALASFIVDAPTRLGPISTRGFLGRDRCYTHRMPEASEKMHEIDRNNLLISRLGISSPINEEPELYADLSLGVQYTLPQNAILCSLTTSAASKEWPAGHWASLYKNFPELRPRLVFTAGPSEREDTFFQSLKKLIPGAHFLDPCPSIGELMAIISRSSAVISGDTFTSHAAGGLGVPVLTLIGPTDAKQWHPRGKSVILEAPNCHCKDFFYKCTYSTHCLSTVPPTIVYNGLLSLLDKYGSETTNQLSNHCKE